MENKISEILSIDDMMGHFMLIGFTPIIWSLTAGCIIDQVSRICKSELAGLTVLCFLSSGNRYKDKIEEFDVTVLGETLAVQKLAVFFLFLLEIFGLFIINCPVLTVCISTVWVTFTAQLKSALYGAYTFKVMGLFIFISAKNYWNF